MTTGLFSQYQDEESIDYALRQQQVTINSPNSSLSDTQMFLHGHCAVFALALHELCQYPIRMTMDDAYDFEPDEPMLHIAHMYCIIPKRNRTIYIDIRGCTDSQYRFLEPFEDFVTLPAAPLPTPDIEDIRQYLKTIMGVNLFQKWYNIALQIIKSRPNWYKI